MNGERIEGKVQIPRSDGLCFYNNGKAFADKHKEGLLVQGVVLNTLDNKPMSHSWIEVGSKVYDYSRGTPSIVPKGLYYAIGRAQQVRKYNSKQY